ncbi:hypothetical protein LINPERPRIM_LOCUS10233 [Linum perenne]
MFDFGDELTIEGNRIPWLIWIQILVLLLLIFLLYCFSSFNDLFQSAASSSSSDLNRVTDSHRYVSNCQVTGVQSIKGEIAAATATGRRIESVEEFAEGESVTIYHPCDYIKLLFLKCFGFDCESERSSSEKKKKKKRR